MKVCRTPSWARRHFNAGELSGMGFGYGPSFWVLASGVVFNDSGIRRRKQRKLRQRRLAERTPRAVTVLSGF